MKYEHKEETHSTFFFFFKSVNWGVYYFDAI